jgi:hypothetical protein
MRRQPAEIDTGDGRPPDGWASHDHRDHLDGTDLFDADIADRLSIDQLDQEEVAAATRMAAVYVTVATFENMARQLVTNVLLHRLRSSYRVT